MLINHSPAKRRPGDPRLYLCAHSTSRVVSGTLVHAGKFICISCLPTLSYDPTPPPSPMTQYILLKSFLQ